MARHSSHHICYRHLCDLYPVLRGISRQHQSERSDAVGPVGRPRHALRRRLSAAGFGISAAVYLLGMERYRPILRASILISFLGYLTVCVGYLYEIGLPWRFWHPIVMWNHRSVLFDVCVCIMTYTTVLTFEFAPAVIEKLPWKAFRETVLHYHHKILIGVVLAGVLLSSMHQSFLGGLFLITRGKLHPLWYSPYMHAMFYLSAIPAGLALTVMAIYLCMRSLNVRVDFTILSDCGRMIQLLLIVFAFFKVLDLAANQALGYAFQFTQRKPDTSGWRCCCSWRYRSRCSALRACATTRSGCTGLCLRGGGIHGRPAECVDQCAANGDGHALRAQVERAGVECAGDCGRSDGVPLCGHLSRHTSESSSQAGAALDLELRSGGARVKACCAFSLSSAPLIRGFRMSGDRCTLFAPLTMSSGHDVELDGDFRSLFRRARRSWCFHSFLEIKKPLFPH